MPIMSRWRQKKPAAIFSRRKSIAFFVFAIVCIVILLLSLIIFDNMRVAVRTLSVNIPALSKEHKGYTILHISDLHGQYFGSEQSTIMSSIGSREFDCAVITGDLVHTAGKKSEEKAALDLVKALKGVCENIYIITGNHDKERAVTGEDGKVEEYGFYKELESAGAVMLDSPIDIFTANDGSKIWLYPVELLQVNPEYAESTLEALAGESELDFPQALMKERYEGLVSAETQKGEKDTFIGLSHYPLTHERLLALSERQDGSFERYAQMDLVLSGHYHNGQIRLPIIGALYVPEAAWSGGGLFPDNKKIYGIVNTDGIIQHISGGLGSAGIAPLRFRLFAAPEVTLLTLE